MRGLASSAIGSRTWCIRRAWKYAHFAVRSAQRIPHRILRAQLRRYLHQPGEMPFVPNSPALRSAIWPGLPGSLLPAPLRGFESGNHVEDVPASSGKQRTVQQVCRHPGGQRSHAPGVLAARCRPGQNPSRGVAQSRAKGHFHAPSRDRHPAAIFCSWAGSPSSKARPNCSGPSRCRKAPRQAALRNYRGRRSRTRESPGPCQPPTC